MEVITTPDLTVTAPSVPGVPSISMPGTPDVATVSVPNLTNVGSPGLERVTSYDISVGAPAVDIADTTIATGDIPSVEVADVLGINVSDAPTTEHVVVPSLGIVNAPQVSSVDISESPVAPNIDTSIDIPVFDLEAPSIDIPALPIVTLPTAPGNAPVMSDVELPAAPSITLPVAPSVSITIPTAPEISVAEFNDEAPIVTLTPPTSTFSFEEITYDSYVNSATSAIDNLGGLSESVEAAEWARAKARLDISNERTYNEALSFWSSRGWALPVGAMTGRLTEALTEQTRAEQQLSYEVMIKAADINHDANKVKAASYIELEKVVSDYANKVAQRAFDSAKVIQDTALVVFNSQVALYNAEMDLSLIHI